MPSMLEDFGNSFDNFAHRGDAIGDISAVGGLSGFSEVREIQPTQDSRTNPAGTTSVIESKLNAFEALVERTIASDPAVPVEKPEPTVPLKASSIEAKQDVVNRTQIMATDVNIPKIHADPHPKVGESLFKTQDVHTELTKPEVIEPKQDKQAEFKDKETIDREKLELERIAQEQKEAEKQKLELEALEREKLQKAEIERAMQAEKRRLELQQQEIQDRAMGSIKALENDPVLRKYMDMVKEKNPSLSAPPPVEKEEQSSVDFGGGDTADEYRYYCLDVAAQTTTIPPLPPGNKIDFRVFRMAAARVKSFTQITPNMDSNSDIELSNSAENSITNLSEDYNDFNMSEKYRMILDSVKMVEEDPHTSLDQLTLIMETICTELDALQAVNPPSVRMEFWTKLNDTWFYAINKSFETKKLKRYDWKVLCETIVAVGK
jgi:phage terminase small subunit